MYVVIDSLFIVVNILAGFMYLVFVLLRSSIVNFNFTTICLENTVLVTLL